MSALHQAAAELIGQASELTVRAVLRLLLGDTAPARPPVTARPRTVPTHAPPSRRKRRPHDPVWEVLRSAIRRAMAERGASWADLGAVIGRSAHSVKTLVCSRQPPGPSLQAKLRVWLDANGTAAPAVASPAAPFRGGRSKRPANGAATSAA